MLRFKIRNETAWRQVPMSETCMTVGEATLIISCHLYGRQNQTPKHKLKFSVPRERLFLYKLHTEEPLEDTEVLFRNSSVIARRHTCDERGNRRHLPFLMSSRQIESNRGP
jgi:hypothetical protein